ncbi:MAG: TOBE domain-containing protein [Candidatus Bathyarchaeota archaeon]|nr:MAG: TOBE domain-containing protein [Candidatus Bathyarchaeota archaeon]
MKISARNRLRGSVKSVEKGVVTAKIEIEIAAPTIVTAVITKEATEELNIQVRDAVEAVVKATGVMVAKAG